MKKFLFVASLVMLSLSANAQKAAGSFTFQPKVGLNIARNTDTEGSDPRLGLAIGTELEYQIRDKFSVAAGFIYSMQGLRQSGETGYGYATATYKLDYINLPIVFNAYVYKGLALKFGVQPGFNISSKVTFTMDGNTSTGALSGMDVRLFDLSIPVGISYEMKSGIVFDARYNIGVTKIYDARYYNSYTDQYETLDSRNCVVQLTVGYKFNL
ncbi:MAG: PorT family protein [Bacteroidaceae bacterium]|nr:PorT family protein [Bacteroidaceae bacterium]